MNNLTRQTKFDFDGKGVDLLILYIKNMVMTFGGMFWPTQEDTMGSSIPFRKVCSKKPICRCTIFTSWHCATTMKSGQIS